jgi:hypothetical protein
MATFTPFFCRVTPYGTPHFVPLESSSHTFILNNLSAQEVCHYYWLLHKLVFYYKLTFSGSLVVEKYLSMGTTTIVPRNRLISVPAFSGSLFDSSTGIIWNGAINFSKIYLQDDGQYAIDLQFAAYNQTEGLGESHFLLSFGRSLGDSGQRDAYQSTVIDFMGKNISVYLNYNSQIWSGTSIALNDFSLTATFYDNDVL